jgi:hypothetical protein
VPPSRSASKRDEQKFDLPADRRMVADADAASGIALEHRLASEKARQEQKFGRTDDKSGSEKAESDKGDRKKGRLENPTSLGAALGVILTIGAAAGTERIRALRVDQIERESADAARAAEARLRQREAELRSAVDSERLSRSAAELARDLALAEVRQLRLATAAAAAVAARVRSDTERKVPASKPTPARSAGITRAQNAQNK